MARRYGAVHCTRSKGLPPVNIRRICEMYTELELNPATTALTKILSAAMLGKAANLRPSLFHAGVLLVGLGVVCHKAVTYLVLYPVFRLLFGTLYPAYASYKAVRTKNVKEYVKWMMYWIVFALFTCIETFTDVFLSWFPFYYEIKIVLVIWLLSPATKGSSILYRKFVHPTLSSREQEIDEYITKAKEQSYRQVLDLGSKGVTVLMQTAIKSGGGIVNQLRRSYSLSDLTDANLDEAHDETDDVVITDPRLMRRRRSPHRTSSSVSGMYFSEVDVRSDRIASIQSAEDISSGYSSGEGLYPGQPPKLAAREGLHRAGSLTRSRTTRVTRSTIIRKSGGSDDSDENELFDTNIVFQNDPKTTKPPTAQPADTSSEDEFLDSLDTLHDKRLGKCHSATG
ncbi:hypothetical protein NQ317_003280 [Molorchus minor]|uniref:Receptor expression-enhancing protein n=1 Tax=Molorchus minor TaxID=1323400 RepID=A0ABQ9IXS4_9CUCU|nr:hypothetical protein NQ317_003280 [Molorchus minor]